MDTLATESKLDIQELINSLILSDVSFALYRLPDQQTFRIIISSGGYQKIESVDFDELPEGFVFAPYNSAFSKPLYLRGDFCEQYTFSDSEINLPGLKCNLKQVSASQIEEGFSFEPCPESDNREQYFAELSEIIRKIKSGDARKVVLSRRKKLGKLKEKNYFKAFKRLCGMYSEAMVSLVNLPELAQTWLGATPEVLVSQDKNMVFRTMSLAGTQPSRDKEGREINPIDALWSHKEIEEQAIVGRYIINCLKKIRVREFEEEGPRTIKAGNLLHLRTFYSIDNKLVNFPDLSSVMLGLLHPTPAICGMPKEDAERIISETEVYNREFYSGYLGPVNVGNESHLYVNLRTMKIDNEMVYTYAGGGILADSVPEKEWYETEIKMETIKKAFDN